MPPKRKGHKEKEMRVSKRHKIAQVLRGEEHRKVKKKGRWPFQQSQRLDSKTPALAGRIQDFRCSLRTRDGDGVDEDDNITNGGVVGFEVPTSIRADQVTDQSVRLPYFKFPRNPTK